MVEHTAKAFDADLQDLTRLIMEMGGRAERLTNQAVEALTMRNIALARQIIADDDVIDALQHEIEEKAIVTIARRQPMAVDLRDIVSAFRVASELERIGDLAKNIAKRTMTLSGDPHPIKTVRGIRHMTAVALAQLSDALECFARRNPDKAFSVWNRDEEVDSLYTSLFRELLTYMMEDPGVIASGIHLLFCAKNIERIGDHATNIVETAYFMVEGRQLAGERPKRDMTSSIAMPMPV